MGFGDVIDKSNKRIRASSDFVKLTSDRKIVLRVLDDTPVVCWQHFVSAGHKGFPNVNKGKGMGIICPGKDSCPVCKWNSDKTKEEQIRSRKIYTFNVLDRSVVKTCPSCGEEFYGKKNKFPAACTCGESMSEIVPEPRNKIMLMQKGIKIADQIREIQEEFGEDLTDRDITIETRGSGNETSSVCIVDQASFIDFTAILGDDWENQKFNLGEVTAPYPIEVIGRVLNGESFFEVMNEKTSTDE